MIVSNKCPPYLRPFFVETIGNRLAFKPSCQTSQGIPSVPIHHSRCFRTASPPASSLIHNHGHERKRQKLYHKDQDSQQSKCSSEVQDSRDALPFNLNLLNLRLTRSLHQGQDWRRGSHPPRDRNTSQEREKYPGKDTRHRPGHDPRRPIRHAQHEEEVPQESPQPREGSITTSERETFRRIFDNISTIEAPVPSDLDQPGDLSEAARNFLRVEDDDFTGDNGMDTEAIPVIDEAKIDAFPKPLRDMARRTHDQIAQQRAKLGLSRDPDIVAAKKLAHPIRERLHAAALDTEIWSILEEELFSKIRSLNLDPQTGSQGNIGPMPPGKATADANNAEASFSETTNLAVFSLVYRSSLLTALRLLCRRTTYTPLAFALLPAVKALGPSSYAMGVSTAFFNELILHHWRIYNSMPSVLSLLDEMDKSLLAMNTGTLDALEQITLHRWKASKGMFGEANQELEALPERQTEGGEIWRWKRRIREQLQQAEIEKVRRREQEQALREEGALGGEDDGPVASAVPA